MEGRTGRNDQPKILIGESNEKLGNIDHSTSLVCL